MIPDPALQQSFNRLATPLSFIKGVGPALLKKFARLSLTTAEDLLLTLPLRYEDRRFICNIGALKAASFAISTGIVQQVREALSPRGHRKFMEAVISDGSGYLILKWFHYRKDWLTARLPIGRKILVAGEIKIFSGSREIHHPEIELAGDGGGDETFVGQILPVYPLTEGLTQKAARRVWSLAIKEFASDLSTAIPAEIMERQQLLHLDEAIRLLHQPPRDCSMEQLSSGKSPALRTMVFDEFFFLQLGLALKQRGTALEAGLPFAVTHRYTRPLAKMLPFRLTDAQRRVLGEIKHDLMQPHPMNRLLQGDVGSGKTVVALMSALLAIENNYQVAIVAPTEILAEQHFRYFSQWLSRLELSTVLILGSQPAKERKEVLHKIKTGEAHLIVGTHAALQDHVDYHRLGLGIIDEQHRFGVKQRGVLRKKGGNPHMLIMSATPIPRTLSMTLYGNLALSVIDELPPGRTPVVTRIINEQSRQQAFELIRREVAEGRQVYVVYPLIEESEKTDLQAASVGFAALQQRFLQLELALLHGRLASNEKEAIMGRFKNGEIDILVSTTVIEVGIDVPNATLMIIEQADRFGLSQLHQLRGRVGRGGEKSYCLLIQPRHCSKEARSRLQVMTETTDGFRIAEEDLKLRGPGEFLGIRQAGLPELRIANLLRDGEILEAARKEAFQLVNSEIFDHAPQYAQTRAMLRHRWAHRLELAGIG